MEKGKTGKYLKYAIGEIILVVIGILIALQINTWNNSRIDHKKELNYLMEIRDNLFSDTLKIEEVLSFNAEKSQVIIDCIKELANPNTPMNRLKAIGSRMYMLGSYEVYNPNNLGFNNLLSAEQIDLISNDSLRKQLLDFYSFDFSNSTQKRVVDVTRKFVDYTLPKIAVKEHFAKEYEVLLDLPSAYDVKVYNDPYIIANLDLMISVMNSQNRLVTDKKKVILQIVSNIEQELAQ